MLDSVHGCTALHANAHAADRAALLARYRHAACIAADQHGSRNGHPVGDSHSASVDEEFDGRPAGGNGHGNFAANSAPHSCVIIVYNDVYVRIPKFSLQVNQTS